MTGPEKPTHTVSLDFESREDAEWIFARLERLEWIMSSGATLSLRSAAEAVAQTERNTAASQLATVREGAEALIKQAVRERDAAVSQAREAARAEKVIEAARALVAQVRYLRGLPDDDPYKGAGNRLADILAEYDRALATPPGEQ